MRLADFLENVALVEGATARDAVRDATGQHRDAITLMTIHAAKGLEFSVVFLVGLEEGLFPHSRSLMDMQELEEERRLCYVALTRAKQKLYLTYTKNRLFFGTRSANMLSRFVMDIPQQLLEWHHTAAPWQKRWETMDQVDF